MDSCQKIYFLGGRHQSRVVAENIIEKVNPKTIKLLKIIKGKSDICGRNKSQSFTK